MTSPSTFNRATYFDGKSAQATEVGFRRTHDKVEAFLPDGTTVFSRKVALLRIERHAPDLVVVIDERTGATLELRDPASIRALEPGRRESSPRATFLFWAFLIVAACVALYLLITPLSKVIARRIPAAWEAKAAEAIVGGELFKDRCHAPAGVAALKKMSETLARDSGLDVPPTVGVFRNPAPNAFTIFGGHVLLTSELLAKATDPSEVVGILGHEYGHLYHRHLLASFVRAGLLTLIWTAGFGDVSGFLILDPSTAQQLLSRSFDRDSEREADDFALALLRAKKIPPAGMAQFFAREKEKNKWGELLSIFSTHPADTEREARFRAAAAEPLFKRADKMAGLTIQEWHALRNICEPDAAATVPKK